MSSLLVHFHGARLRGVKTDVFNGVASCPSQSMVLPASVVDIGEVRRDGSHGVLSRLEDCRPSSQEATQGSFNPYENIPKHNLTRTIKRIAFLGGLASP